MKLMEATNIAMYVMKQLHPLCEKINIAGSVRRKKSEVKDIEIVCLPRKINEAGEDLFGDVLQKRMVVTNLFKRVVYELGDAIKGTPSGRYMQIFLKPYKINLDLFMPEPDDYYRQFAIRTGSANYSSLMIASGWKRMGWCGTEKGLRKISECEEKKIPGTTKSIWICTKLNPTLPPVWKSEKEFFEFIGVRWINPELRYVH